MQENNEKLVDQIVNLNVGGKFMSVASFTFNNNREPNNLLNSMITSQKSIHQSMTNVKVMNQDQILDNSPIYFIDCDPKCFTYILDWFKYGIYDSDMTFYTYCKMCKICEEFHLENLKTQLTTNMRMQQNYAQQGHSAAQYNLGLIYYNGNSNISRNLEKAVELFEKSALQGNSDAQYRIGIMYEEGEFLLESQEKAFEWYKKSSDQGHAHAQYSIGVLYEQGIPNSPTFAGIQSNYSIAFEYYEKSSMQNVPEAFYNLGLMYELGKGTTASLEKALECFEKAAQQSDADAQCKLGLFCKDGNRIVKKDLTRAFEWFQKSALQGNDRAQCELANFYLKGVGGIEKSEKVALEWYRKAANQGNFDAKTYLRSLTKSVRSVSTVFSFRKKKNDDDSDTRSTISSMSNGVVTDI